MSIVRGQNYDKNIHLMLNISLLFGTECLYGLMGVLIIIIIMCYKNDTPKLTININQELLFGTIPSGDSSTSVMLFYYHKEHLEGPSRGSRSES